MLMLSSFQRVLRVSALVSEPCRHRHAAARRKPRARASVPRRRAPTLRPALLNPPMAALSPATHRSTATRRHHCHPKYRSRRRPSSGHPGINRDHSQVALVSLMLPHPSLAAGKPPHRRNRRFPKRPCSVSRQGPQAKIQTSAGGFLQGHRLIGIVFQGLNRLKL